MISYTIYNKATGLIRKSFFAANADSVESYYNSEIEAVLEGDINGNNFKIIEGNVVEIPPPSNYEEDNRHKRNFELKNSDWTQVPDSPLTDSKKAEWRTYRQALRDLPTNSSWPDIEDSDWPIIPS